MHVALTVFAAVRNAPPAEVAVAGTAFHRKAIREIQESGAAARALECENFVDDVLSSIVHCKLSLTHLCATFQLGGETTHQLFFPPFLHLNSI
jgi:hypothetical protein